MQDVAVIDDPLAAAVALDPARSRLLAELSEPASAAALAQRLGMGRQKVNYHLRTLLAHGLVKRAGTRRWGGLTERRMVATAGSYVVSPAALGPVGADPGRTADRLSASYLLSLAARALKEVGGLVRRAAAADKRLATLSIDAEIAFRSAEERAAFSRELAEGLAALAARYHDPAAPGSRPHRILVLAHPTPEDTADVATDQGTDPTPTTTTTQEQDP